VELVRPDAKYETVGARDNSIPYLVSWEFHGPKTHLGASFERGAWYGPSSSTFQTEIISHQLQLPFSGQNAKLRMITDGLSRTIMVFEQAGMPDRRNMFNLQMHDCGSFKGPWAFLADTRVVHDGTPVYESHFINWDNCFGLYSFHPGGAHVSRFDGSVTFLAEDTATDVVGAMLLRADGKGG
jgi:prepilin-type processing-associated H-X9-DG protein